MIVQRPIPDRKCPACNERDRLPNCPLCFECRDEALAKVMPNRHVSVTRAEELVDERSEW